MRNKELPIYTADDIMTKLKISRMTLYRLMKEGHLPFRKVNRFLRFTEADIRDFLYNIRQTNHKKLTLANP